MNDIERKGPKRFNAKQREDLGDARLVLDTALHNLRAAITNPDPGEAIIALETALTMIEQTTETLRRVREANA
jgi:hypothetical protein